MIVRLAYVGPVMAGKHTSLANGLKEPVSGIMRADGQYARYSFRRPGGAAFDILAMISIARSLYYYQDPIHEDLHPNVAKEIDALALADSIIFVADSQPQRMLANRQQFDALCRDLESKQVSLESKTVVIQVNKRDLPQAVPLADVRKLLNISGASYVESVATDGRGVVAAIEEALRGKS